MKHHELGMSRWPVWAVCPFFDGKEGQDEYAKMGTDAHADLEQILKGERDIEDTTLNESARWAAGACMNILTADGVVNLFASSEQEVEIKRYTGDDPDILNKDIDIVGIFGTSDFIALQKDTEEHVTITIADFKTFGTGKNCYDEQLAGYAWGFACSYQNGYLTKGDLEKISVNLITLNGVSRIKTITPATLKDCALTAIDIIHRRKTLVNFDPCVNPKCKYCKHMPCRAHLQIGKASVKQGDILATSSEDMELSPDKIVTCMSVCNEVKKLCTDLEKRIKEAVIKTGAETCKNGLKKWVVKSSDGNKVEVREQLGNRTISDVVKTWESVQDVIEQDKFLDMCSLKVSSLVDEYKTKKGITQEEAEKELDEMKIFKRGKNQIKIYQ